MTGTGGQPSVDDEVHGPRHPLPGPPPRQPGSIRRTTSIDTYGADDLWGDRTIVGRARDSVFDAAGVERRDEVELRITTRGPERAIATIESEPPVPALGELAGRPVGAGFRRAVSQLLPEEREARSLLHLLLDDLPGASLVSGFAALREHRQPFRGGDDGYASAIEDLCAGWASDAHLMVTARGTGFVPTPDGARAPRLDDPGEPASWHPLDELPPGTTRRARRLDLVAPPGGGPLALEVHFRDTLHDTEGALAFHEYLLSGALAPEGDRVAALEAEARVLPWRECPGALGSARRVLGVPLGELDVLVRRELVGTSTCTHLNDTLRSLADLDVLARRLTGALGTDQPG